jgi:hypothetical protein
VRKELRNAGQGLAPELVVEKFADMPSRGLGSGLAEAAVETSILTVVLAAGAVAAESSRSSRSRRPSPSSSGLTISHFPSTTVGIRVSSNNVSEGGVDSAAAWQMRQENSKSRPVLHSNRGL